MENLTVLKNENVTINSLEVAEMLERRHSDLLKNIRHYIKFLTNANLLWSKYFIKSSYIDAKEEERPCYLLTKMGCEMVAHKITGQKGVIFTARYVEKFNEMEEELRDNPFRLPRTYKDALKQLVNQVEENEKLQLTIESQKPKVIFAEAVETSKSSILVSELAKILHQNGINTGQRRLFEWLREKGYLIKRKGSEYNMPSQRAMEMGLFEIKETCITHSDGHISVSKTSKVTGKGQVYFVNEFKKNDKILRLC